MDINNECATPPQDIVSHICAKHSTIYRHYFIRVNPTYFILGDREALCSLEKRAGPPFTEATRDKGT